MTEADMRLAIVRSEQLMNFYAAERRNGATPLEANERMHFFAQRLDSPSPFEIEQAAIAAIRELVS